MQINGITYKEEAIKAAKNKRIIMNNLIARFNVNIASKEDLELLLSNIQFKFTGTFELDIMKNPKNFQMAFYILSILLNIIKMRIP